MVEFFYFKFYLIFEKLFSVFLRRGVKRAMLNFVLFFFINAVAVDINFDFEFVFLAGFAFFGNVVSEAVLIAQEAR